MAYAKKVDKNQGDVVKALRKMGADVFLRSEEHTSELQSH